MGVFTARAGLTIRASTGYEGLGVADRMSTVFFVKARKGDRLRLLDKQYYFNVAGYAPQADSKYIYSYAYQPDESWMTYKGDLSAKTKPIYR